LAKYQKEEGRGKRGKEKINKKEEKGYKFGKFLWSVFLDVMLSIDLGNVQGSR
jgi:hypothetical protein